VNCPDSGVRVHPSGGRSKTVEPEQGSSVEKDVADLNHALETHKLSFIHLIPSEQLGVVAEIAQKPIQLPQGFGVAIEAARNFMASPVKGNLAETIHRRFAAFGGLEIELPRRDTMRQAPEFAE
jgi:hypothetical protein